MEGKFKGTKGNWMVDTTTYEPSVCSKTTGEMIVERVGHEDMSEEESAANALLIAHAPELLEHLQGLLYLFDRGLKQGTVGYSACMEAKSTITAALGTKGGEVE